MASVTSVGVSVRSDAPAVNGTNITFNIQISTDSGKHYIAGVTVPVGATAAQRATAIQTAVQAVIQSGGDVLASVPTFAILGG